jgi:GT2 family glycosyltransferase
VIDQTYTDFEIIVVDNGSTDDSVAFVKEQFPTVRLLCLEKNLGFAAGNNAGIRASKAPFVATLNNDTRVEPGWLAALVSAIQSRPQVGMCASKMLFYDRPQMINSAGICLDRAGIAWDRHGGRLTIRVSEADQEPTEIFGASAGAALYRRTMLDEVGLFDEDFFAYLEDVDLAWRARLAGWRCLYIPSAVVYHRHSATAIEGSPFKSRLLGRNKVWIILKNYPWPALLFFLPLIVAYDLGSVSVALLQQRNINPLIGRLLAIPQLPAVLAKRFQIQRARKISAATMLALMEPVTTPQQVIRRYQHLR